jgi:hypothetical protein
MKKEIKEEEKEKKRMKNYLFSFSFYKVPEYLSVFWGILGLKQ